MTDQGQTGISSEEVLKWVAAQACKDVVLSFMGLFDMRAWAEMKRYVMPDIEWQRPDVTIRGVAQLVETLHATPDNVRVRHVITNLRATFNSAGGIVIDSYFTVYRLVGTTADMGVAVPFDGPVSVGRYRDELVRIDGAWRIARKETAVDFRRNQA